MTNPISSEPRTGPAAGQTVGRRGLLLGGCWLGLGGLGCLDYATGYELSFFVFYSAPVGVAAWWVGRWSAIGVALGATVTWLLADYFSGAKYSAPFFYYWNSSIHFLAFIINAVTIAEIKRDLDRRHVLEAELEATRETLRAVAALVPVCPGCGKRRDPVAPADAGHPVPVIGERPDLVVAICEDCRAKAGRAEGSSA